MKQALPLYLVGAIVCLLGIANLQGPCWMRGGQTITVEKITVCVRDRWVLF